MATAAPSMVVDPAMAVGTFNQSFNEKSKVLKPRKPNYNLVHQNLLPVEVYPLPTLIPHNPLSLLTFAYLYLSRVISPPWRKVHNSYFSSATSSIHVTDEESIRKLWEMGFFGRGSLSRSEPTWQDTQRRKGRTAEENTVQRRDERRQLKFERARKEQEELTQQLSKERQTTGIVRGLPQRNIVQETVSATLPASALRRNDTDIDDVEEVLNSTADKSTTSDTHGPDQRKQSIGSDEILTPPPTSVSEGESEQPVEQPVQRLHKTKSVRFSPTAEAREFDLSQPTISPIKSPGICAEAEDSLPSPAPASTAVPETENKEHLNLSLEEAFFLSYGMGVLDIYCEDSDKILSPTSLLSLFRRYSYHPTKSLAVSPRPDDPFMLSYAVYHHYRSLGWVVRSGVKFSVDYLLYNRGPAFAHAEFAIVVLPSYSHSCWSETVEQRNYVASRTRKSWDWLHGVNRVQAQVHKSLILCYVEVPPPLRKAEKGHEIDIEKELSRYTVRDVAIKRWTPNRTRE